MERRRGISEGSVLVEVREGDRGGESEKTSESWFVFGVGGVDGGVMTTVLSPTVAFASAISTCPSSTPTTKVMGDGK